MMDQELISNMKTLPTASYPTDTNQLSVYAIYESLPLQTAHTAINPSVCHDLSMTLLPHKLGD